MAKQFVNQHIVPKIYLDRFASKVDGKNIIGTRYYVKKQPKIFETSTSEVGYIKNYYDVTDKADPKYWEHYFARKIDALCGRDLKNIISAIALSRKNAIVLSEEHKRILSKIIVAQMMRVPGSVESAKEIYSRVEQSFKDNVIDIIPEPLKKKYKLNNQSIGFDEQWQKEQFLDYAFSPENFDRYCGLIQNQIWVVFVNTHRDNMPFVTSDNPVLVEGVGKKKLGLFYNGLASPTTCIFFPITPTIAISVYSRDGIMGGAADELNGRKFLLSESDLKYIIDKNYKIIEQAYHHSFIPQPLYDTMMKTDH